MGATVVYTCDRCGMQTSNLTLVVLVQIRQLFDLESTPYERYLCKGAEGCYYELMDWLEE